jgi:hypothetical protein
MSPNELLLRVQKVFVGIGKAGSLFLLLRKLASVLFTTTARCRLSHSIFKGLLNRVVGFGRFIYHGVRAGLAAGSGGLSRLNDVFFGEGTQFGQVARDATVGVLNDFAQCKQGSVLRSLFLRLKDDLGQSGGGDVVLSFIVDDHDLFVGADHFGDIVQSDIAALLSVVELSILIPFNDLHFFAVILV